MSLPRPAANQAFCHVSALEAGHVKLPIAWVLSDVSDEEMETVPALAFLIRHHANKDKILFDLGLRKDWQNLPPPSLEYFTKTLRFEMNVSQDVVDALAKGGLQPADIPRICISHLHLDHFGNTALFPTSHFLVGEGGRPLIADGYPKNQKSGLPVDTLPEGRTTFLDPESWPALGPFPHALDFYRDGSLYIVDAGAGHVPGHVNFLVRTSSDGGWIYLAGDSAHHRSILDGTGRIGHHPILGCAHHDAGVAEEHIERIRTLMEKNPRVRVILAHELPWYEENKNGPAFWPGTIQSL